MRPMTVVALAMFALTMVGGAAVAQTPKMPGSVHMMNGMFMDAKGMTLYTFDNDKEANKSACAGNCLNNWPVLKAEAADKDMGDWTVITRDDNGTSTGTQLGGSKQWAYKGKPIYYFVMDKAAGDKLGDGRGMVWHIAKP